MAYSTGVTMSDSTAANDRPNMMHTAIEPKNGSVSSGIVPNTVVSTTMHTGLILLVAFIKTAIDDYNPINSYTVISVGPFDVGGIFVISVGSLILGVILMFVMKWYSPAFFAGEVLSRDTDVAALTAEPTEGLPVLPDSMSQEVFVEPPLSVEQLREAEHCIQRCSQLVRDIGNEVRLLLCERELAARIREQGIADAGHLRSLTDLNL